MTLNAISISRLKTCHPDLQKVVTLAASRFPLMVICGYRGKEDQNKAFESGASKLKYPRSRHNKNPSLAVDLGPVPLDWNNTDRFKEMADVVMKAAVDLGISLVWGGSWKGIVDMPHFQLATTESDQSA